MKYVLLFLIIIIIFNIIYYLYNTRKNIENFSCNIKDLTGGKIDSRPCTIYLTDNIIGCELMTEFYKKGLTQLDILIYKYGNSDNPDDINYVQSLIEVKNNKLQNINNCKVELKDWKEIKNYYDLNGNPLTNDIMPYKSVRAQDNINIVDNFLMSGSCFKEYKKDEIIDIFNNENFSKCDYFPITNIEDMSDNNIGKEYIGLDIKLSSDLKYNTLNDNLCSANLLSSTQTFDINTKQIFIRIKCYMDNNILKSKYVEFVNFNNKINDFDIINDDILIQSTIDNLFRYFYDIINKNIMYGPIKIDTNCIIVEYNSCNKIDKIDNNKCTFTFTDFNINNLNVGSYNKILNDSDVVKLDDGTKNYKSDIIKLLSDKRNESLKLGNDIQGNIDSNKNTYSQLKTSYFSKQTECSTLTGTNLKYNAQLASYDCKSMPDTILDKTSRDAAVSAENAAIALAKANKAIADKATADKIAANKAASDKAIADKAAADKAVADKIIADAKALEIDIKNTNINYNATISLIKNALDISNSSGNSSDIKNNATIICNKISNDLNAVKNVVDFSYAKKNNTPIDPKLETSEEDIMNTILYSSDVASYALNSYFTYDVSDSIINYQINYYKAIWKDFILDPATGNYSAVMMNDYTLLFNTSFRLFKYMIFFYMNNGTKFINNTIKKISSSDKIKNYNDFLNSINNYYDAVNNNPSTSYNVFNRNLNNILNACCDMLRYYLDDNIVRKYLLDQRELDRQNGKEVSTNPLSDRDIQENKQLTRMFSTIILCQFITTSDINLKKNNIKIIRDYYIKFKKYFIENTEYFTNYDDNYNNYNNVEHFTINDNDYMIRNTSKEKCNNDVINLQNTIKKSAGDISACNAELNKLSLLQQSVASDYNQLVASKTDADNLFINIKNLIDSFNKQLTINDINKLLKDTSILNFDNYANYVSNDDYIYISVI